MMVITLTTSEYANLYGCSTQFVTEKLRNNTMLTGMINFRKVNGKTGSYLIDVLKSWVDSKK
jgi:hypothetical protein